MLNSSAVTGRDRLIRAVLILALTAGALVALPVTKAAAACTGNAVVCENQLPGTPASTWDIDGAGDDSIQGFSTQISVNAGNSVAFKVDSSNKAFSIQIYRLGYYQGNGARLITTIPAASVTVRNQPACVTSTATEIYDCGTWGVNYTWTVPATSVSGVYIARLIRSDTGGASHIPFVVRNDGNTSKILFQTSDPTWQAYNTYGGSNFYNGKANGRAYKVSYNRPIVTRGNNDGRDMLFSNEYPMIRFLEQNGYDVSYVSGLDVNSDANLLPNHKVFLSVGHDEYWSQAQRANVTNARNAGVNLAFFSGNEVYWKTRWEPSQDGANTANRTLVCYKDTWAYTQIDPVTPTATWRDPRFGDLGFGPENGLTGTLYMANSDDLPIKVTAEQGKTRLWRNTTLTSLANGATAQLADHTIGYESDEDLDNGYRNPGQIQLSTTVGPTPEYLQDYGNVVAPGTTTHHLTQYRAASGALVFSAGTIQWAWGLDINHDGNGAAADPRIQQATVNILADMGATATTVMAGLTATTASSDTTPPTSTITAPASGSIAQGSMVTVTGTASDAGGRVAGVEVSTDGGASFHLASGTTSWTYTDILTGSGPEAIQVRATDDSSWTQPTTTKRAMTATCPCTVFGATVPKVPDSLDGGAVTLGTKFTTSSNGFITGVRFYKAAANTGSHTGTLYSAAGAVLATGTFANETASGWQTLTFANAVPVTTGTTYVAAYRAPNGHYSAQAEFFTRNGFNGGTLFAPGGSTPNGVYTDAAAFPTNSYKQTNYYVDAVFSSTDTTPASVTAVSPSAASSSVLTGVTPKVTFSKAVTNVTMTVRDSAATSVPGTTSYDSASRTATFTPAQNLSTGQTFTVTVSATGLAAPYSWSFSTVAASGGTGCPCSLFDDTTQPSSAPDGDSAAVQLGVAFRAARAGTITAIRFFKQDGNTGTHTVKLAKTDGTVLGTATAAGETTNGWQVATFTAPVTIAANTTYVASYTAPNGHYSFTGGGLSSVITKAPLSSVATGGRYSYGSGAVSSTSTANYYVDPVFAESPSRAPAVTDISPGTNATSVPVTSSVLVTFDTDVAAGTTQITLKTAGGANVPGTVANETPGQTVSFTPTSDLSPSSGYTVTVSGATSTTGTAMTGYTSSFTTAGADACPCSLLSSTATPVQSDSEDSTALTLGLKFTPSVNGSVTGVRYYRDASNTGPHVGKLWSSTGSELASVTFAEVGVGWQTATFNSAVAVTAGTTYVVSYSAPNGHYSATTHYFDSPVMNTPLSSVDPGGVYAVGNAFPTSSYLNSNYFVDVIFRTSNNDPPAVTATTPGDGAVVATTTPVNATFDRAIDAASLTFSLTPTGGTAVSGTATYDTATKRATFTPAVALPAGTTFTGRVNASSASGVPMTAAKTWTFQTAGAPPTGTAYSLFSATDTPAIPAYNDSDAVSVGVQFSSTSAGSVTALKFYLGAGNTGTKTATLWSPTATALASGSTTSTTVGWTTITLATPVAITANTTYTVSYWAPKGHYSVTTGTYASGYTAGPLSVPTGGAVYRYSTGFPSSPSNANYWVDVVVVS